MINKEKFIRKIRIGRLRTFGGRLLIYAFLTGISYLLLFPFLYMVVTSVKNYSDLYDFTVKWVPHEFHWQNYAIAYNLLNYWNHFGNSLMLTTVCTLGHLLSASFIAYGFARYSFPGKKILFFILLLLIIIPPQVIIVPSYMLFSNINWERSYLPLIVPCFFGAGLKGGLFIYIFRQFYLNLPKDIENAAKIDGCNYLQTYLKIVLPMGKSSLLVALILSAVWHCNDYYEPSIYATGSSMILLPQKTYMLTELVSNPPFELISQFVTGEGNPINTATLMAGTVMCLAPLILLFSVLQTRFMEGIERTGLVE